MSEMPRRKMPKQIEIFRYWLGRTEFLTHRKPNDEPFGCLLISPEDAKRPVIGCFACGRPDTVRAHIKARAEGGSDSADNLHLFCGGCHTDSEVLSGDPYWTWLRSIRRLSYADHYAIRFGYTDFESFCAGVTVIVIDCCPVSPSDMTPPFVASVGSRHIGTEHLRPLNDMMIRKRLEDANLPDILANAFIKCRDAMAGGLLQTYLLSEIRSVIVKASSVRSANAIRKPRSATLRRVLSDEEKQNRSEQRQAQIDRIALEYGHILLDLEGTGLARIAAHLDEIEAPSPYGREKWTALAVKNMTARYRELI